MSDEAWQSANLAAITAEVATIRARLQADLGVDAVSPPSEVPPVEGGSTLDALQDAFELSDFERRVVALALAVEVDTEVAALCARRHGDPARPHATFRIALDTLEDPHWSAVAPEGPLRRFGVVELGVGGVLTSRPLGLPERILHGLLGADALDSELAEVARPLSRASVASAEHVELAADVASDLAEDPSTVIQIRAARRDVGRAFARALCDALGVPGLRVPASPLLGADDASRRVRLATVRESRLSRAVTLLEIDEAAPHDALARFIERFDSPLVVLGDRPLPATERTVRAVEVDRSSMIDQRQTWASASGGQLDDLALDRLAGAFDLSGPAIHAAARTARGATDEARFDAVWASCRAQSRGVLGSLAQRVVSQATFADLVGSAEHLDALHRLVRHQQQRYQVYGRWAVPQRGARSGSVALFSGPSRTGKTLAAEAIAGELAVDLYRVRLSAVYGADLRETGRHLDRVFEAAERSSAVLLFDEADALFGKRGDVRDAHDRHAAIGPDDLLSRLQAYRGLAVCTTNTLDALPPALVRRFDCVLAFPFPAAAQREALWRQQLPDGAVYVQALDYSQLAGLTLAGGSIRSIASDALFRAAESDGPVTMSHLRAAALAEYARMERPPTASERWW